jgi:hypothetical protein
VKGESGAPEPQRAAAALTAAVLTAAVPANTTSVGRIAALCLGHFRTRGDHDRIMPRKRCR